MLPVRVLMAEQALGSESGAKVIHGELAPSTAIPVATQLPYALSHTLLKVCRTLKQY